VVGCLDFHTGVQMRRAFAEPVSLGDSRTRYVEPSRIRFALLVYGVRGLRRRNLR
jgi:hypothetical protein